MGSDLCSLLTGPDASRYLGVDLWNSLPPHIVNAKSILSFEKLLDKHWSSHDFKFNPEANKPTQRENNKDLTQEAGDIGLDESEPVRFHTNIAHISYTHT